MALMSTGEHTPSRGESHGPAFAASFGLFRLSGLPNHVAWNFNSNSEPFSFSDFTLMMPLSRFTTVFT